MTRDEMNDLIIAIAANRLKAQKLPSTIAGADEYAALIREADHWQTQLDYYRITGRERPAHDGYETLAVVTLPNGAQGLYGLIWAEHDDGDCRKNGHYWIDRAGTHDLGNPYKSHLTTDDIVKELETRNVAV